MRLKIEIEEVESGETEDVVAGLVLVRKWERESGRKIAELDEDSTVVVDLARLAYNRKHGRNLSDDEFEARFEIGNLDAGGRRPGVDPSDPETAPQ